MVRVIFIVAPCCAIPRDYLSDTPLLCAMGFLVSQHAQLGAIPPPPFLSDSPFESVRSGGALPPLPLKRGVSAILARYPMKTRQMGAIPPSAIQKAADVWKKDVWDLQAFSQTFLELRFSLGDEGKDGKNLNSQTWPGTRRCPSPRHLRPPERYSPRQP